MRQRKILKNKHQTKKDIQLHFKSSSCLQLKCFIRNNSLHTIKANKKQGLGFGVLSQKYVDDYDDYKEET